MKCNTQVRQVNLYPISTMSDLTMTLDLELVKLSNLETVNFIVESRS